MITTVDEQFRQEVARFDLRCTCDHCGAYDPHRVLCAYGYPTGPHRRLPMADVREFAFCKAFELT